MLLGLLREDKGLLRQFIPNLSAESVRQQIESVTLTREKIHTSVDLPISNECKRVMAYAAEEAERLSHRHIGTEHLFLGLLREEGCFAARLLKERGVTLEASRFIVGNPGGGSAGPGEQGHLHAEARVVMRRSIVFHNEADATNCGETFSIDVPRVGDEIKTPTIRGRVTRVAYEYEQADYEVNGQKANLKPEKIVVYLLPFQESEQQKI